MDDNRHEDSCRLTCAACQQQQNRQKDGRVTNLAGRHPAEPWRFAVAVAGQQGDKASGQTECRPRTSRRDEELGVPRQGPKRVTAGYPAATSEDLFCSGIFGGNWSYHGQVSGSEERVHLLRNMQQPCFPHKCFAARQGGGHHIMITIDAKAGRADR